MREELNIKSYNEVKKELCDMVLQERVPHAHLFYNPNGISALELVLSHMAYMHCTNKQGARMCGTCAACLKTSRYIHPDVHFLFPIGSTNKIKGKEVDKLTFLPLWRSFLAKQTHGNIEDWCTFMGSTSARIQIGKGQIESLRRILSQKSFESNIKTILVWLPETLNASSANKMLKMVEEPMPNTYFFFVGLAEYNILPTLRSRMWPTVVPPLDEAIIVARLTQQFPTRSKEEINQVVGLAEGNLRVAEKMLADGSSTYFEEFVSWLRQAYQQGYMHLVEMAEKFHEYAGYMQKSWIRYGLQLLRMVLTTPLEIAHIGYSTPKELTFCKKFTQTVSRDKVIAIVKGLEKLQQVLRRHANAKLAFMQCTIHAAHELKKN